MSGPLSTQSLLHTLPTLLPHPPTRSRPGFIHPTDAVSALIHSIHIRLGFLYIPPSTTLDDDALALPRRVDQSEDDTHSETTAVEREDVRENDGEMRLRNGWNGREDQELRYKHDQSSMEFLIKVGRVGGRISVMGMADDLEPYQFTVMLSDIVNSDFFPWPKADEAEVPDVRGAFTSDSKLRDFIQRYLREIIAKLIPNLQAEGYTDASSSSSSSSAPRPGTTPTIPYFPSQPTSDPSNLNPSNPYNPRIGDRDLDPFPAGLPRPFGGGGLGIPDSSRGGMLVGRDDPMFAGRGGSGGGGSRNLGPGGMINPPGSRWDPVGPGIGIGDGFPRVGGNPLGGMGVGDPDFDELLPPGEGGPDLRMPGSGRGPPFTGPGGGGAGMGGFGGIGGGRGTGGGGFGGGGGGYGGGGGGFYM